MTESSNNLDASKWDAQASLAEVSDPLQMVRLLRVARDSQLSDLSREHLFSDLGPLIEKLYALESAEALIRDPGDDGEVYNRHGSDPALMVSGETLSSAVSEEIRRGASSAAHLEDKGLHPRVTESQEAILEMRLRQLAQSGASWEKMAPLALGLFQTTKKPAYAARVVELAFLHGGIQQVAPLVERFRSEALGFYPLIHPGVRAHLVVRLFAQDIGKVDLSAILFKDREATYLQPVERLYLLLSMMQGHDRAQCYMFFKEHHRSLANAVQMVGASFGLNLATFYLKMAHVAYDIGFNADARELLEAIDSEAPEREEALVLLLRLDSDVTSGSSSPYASELDASPGDRTRLERLGYYLATTRNLGGHRDKNRASLNEILRNPLQWLSENQEIWTALSHLIVNSRDLEPLLPNVMDVFKSNVTHWHSPPLDGALWAGPLSLESGRPVDWYWKGVAKLHHYINSAGLDGGALWEARELVYKARQSMATKSSLVDWQDLHREAFSRVAKSAHLSELEREKMLAELRLASPDTSTTLADVEQYLNQTPLPSMVTLERLIHIAQLKKALGLEALILITRGFLRHLTNLDLGRLWHIACERKEHDLAWRVATILRGRHALTKVVIHPWEISGEKRSQYQLFGPSMAQINQAFVGWPKVHEKLARAILLIGPLLPELLAAVDSKSSTARIGAAPSDSVEALLDQALGQLAWLPVPRRRYVLSYDQAGEDGDIPAFAQVMPANPWSLLVLRLSHRLGLNVWRWRLSFLAEQIVDVIPRLATSRSLGRHSSRVAKWLRALTPEQRTAWHNLSSLSRVINDEEALLCLGKLVCRIATMMMANHAQAQASLIAMRAPVAIMWDLEAFILSPFYGQYRQTIGIGHKVPVPNSLLALPTVVETSLPKAEQVSS